MNIENTQKIVLIENDDLGVPVHIGQHGRALLDRHNQTWKSALGLNRDPFLYHDGRLFARDVTGFASLGSLFAEVAPKFLSPEKEAGRQWRQALWAILSRVYRAPLLGLETPAEVVNADHFPDLLGMTLLHSLRVSKPNGRPRGYVAERGRLNHFQGRLDTGRIMDLVIYPSQVPCEYDVYSENIPANRLLRWSAEQLSFQVRSVPLGYDLTEEALSIRGISPLPPSLAEAERIDLGPHHTSLQPAITIGQLLLQGRGLQHDDGDQTLPGFLWKSSEVFERFVRYLIDIVARTYMKGIRTVKEWVPLADPSVGSQRRLRTEPDIRLEGNGQTFGVLDSKYKLMETQPSASDIYQVVTGAWVRNSAVAALIYPSPEGRHKDTLKWRLHGPSKPTNLWALFVNLTEMGNPSGERILVDQLAKNLDPLIP